MEIISSKNFKYKYIPCQTEQKLGSVVFCHGYATNSDYFDEIAKKLALNYDYYAIELEGMGVTPTDPSVNLTPKLYSLHLAELIRDVLNLQDVILIGHSMGGGVVGMTSNLIPDRIKLLVMVSPMNSSLHVKLLNSFKLTPTNLAKAWEASYIVYKDPYKIFPDGPSSPNLKLMMETQIEIKKHTKNLYRSMNAPLNWIRLRKSEKHISVPTALIVAEDDQIIDAKFAIRRLTKNPNVKPFIIHNSGHVPFVDEPEQFYTVLHHIITTIEKGEEL